LYLGLFAAGRNMFGAAPCREAIFVADAAFFAFCPLRRTKNRAADEF
jgi:hypothetical protein